MFKSSVGELKTFSCARFQGQGNFRKGWARKAIDGPGEAFAATSLMQFPDPFGGLHSGPIPFSISRTTEFDLGCKLVEENQLWE